MLKTTHLIMQCKVFKTRFHSFASRLVLSLLVNIIAVASGVFRSSTESSSYIDTKADCVLVNHVFYSQLTPTLMSCALSCLTKSRCQSFNFDNTLHVDGVKERLCELNDFSSTKQLRYRPGFTYGRLVDLEVDTFIFTNLGGRGSSGPTSVAQYTGSKLEGQVQLVKGIQIWNIPYTGKYVITALGASGGNGTCLACGGVWKKGGKGASITATFLLQKGISLKILVGQQGITQMNFADQPGGGGGGTFVALAKDNKPLIVAGGGGGGGVSGGRFHEDGDPGQAGPNGTRVGGSGGDGGSVVNIDPSSTMVSCGGAGFYHNGKLITIGTAAKSFVNGGEGGTGISNNGGFGGGGCSWTHAGGGGGYSGGGVIGNATSGVAGGGGSYNAGRSQQNVAGVNEGNGKVVIKCFN